MFKNKIELIDFVKNQLNIELENGNHKFNKKRNVLYTKIGSHRHSNALLSLLTQHKIRYETHLNDYGWIFIK